MRRLQRLQDSLVHWKTKLATNAKKCEERNRAMKAEKDAIFGHFQARDSPIAIAHCHWHCHCPWPHFPFPIGHSPLIGNWPLTTNGAGPALARAQELKGRMNITHHSSLIAHRSSLITHELLVRRSSRGG